jgi:hypothetical protein
MPGKGRKGRGVMTGDKVLRVGEHVMATKECSGHSQSVWYHQAYQADHQYGKNDGHAMPWMFCGCRICAAAAAAADSPQEHSRYAPAFRPVLTRQRRQFPKRIFHTLLLLRYCLSLFLRWRGPGLRTYSRKGAPWRNGLPSFLPLQ